MKEIGVGLLGFGTVGAGVAEGLLTHAALIAGRYGVKPILRKIADLDIETDRGVKIDKSLLTRDAESLIRSPDIDVIIELIGGTGVARKLVLQALNLGKPVVTANKALLADHGAEIFAAAAAKNTDVWFEASVGGGIPIIRSLREGLVANRIDAIYGIVNGTCNYILTKMEQEEATFEHALKDAQAAGFAEADPGLDIDGFDTAHKACVLASLAFGFPVPMASAHTEGIRGLAKTDIEYAAVLGYRIKLLAVIKNHDGKIEIGVHPTLVPLSHMLASVSGVFNAVMVEGDIVGQTLYYGRGAGRKPTASAVISDVADVSRALATGMGRRVPAFSWAGQPGTFSDPNESEARYYLRVSLVDRPGMFGKMATVFGDHGISIASVVQKERHAGKHVPVVILTHKAKERNFSAAISAVDAMDGVGAKTIKLRVEDLGIER